MLSFKNQITDILGHDIGDDSMIDESLIASGIEIIKLTPNERLLKIAQEQTIPTGGLNSPDKKILQVHKGNYIAREVELSKKAKVLDNGSIFYATTTDPVYYFDLQKVFIVADGSLTTGKLLSVPIYPTTDGSTYITNASTATTYFPKEAERLMSLGAAIRCLKLTVGKHINVDEDIELGKGSMSQLQLLEASYDKELQKYLA